MKPLRAARRCRRAADRHVRPSQPHVVGHARLHGDRGMDDRAARRGVFVSAAELRDVAAAAHAVSRLLIPTINLALMLVSIIPAISPRASAKRLDEAAVKRWLVITCVVVDSDRRDSLVGALGDQHALGHERVRQRRVDDRRLSHVAPAARRRRYARPHALLLLEAHAGEGVQRHDRQQLLLVLHGRDLDSDLPDRLCRPACLLTRRRSASAAAFALSLGVLLGPVDRARQSASDLQRQHVGVRTRRARGDARGACVCLVVSIGCAVLAYGDWRAVGRGVEDEAGGVDTRRGSSRCSASSVSLLASSVIARSGRRSSSSIHACGRDHFIVA